MMSEFTEYLGWLGMGAVFLAFFLLSLGWLRPRYLFQGLNLAGSIGLLLDNAAKGARPGAALNAIWAVVALGSAIWLAVRDATETSEQRTIRELRDLLDRAYYRRGEYRGQANGTITAEAVFHDFKRRSAEHSPAES